MIIRLFYESDEQELESKAYPIFNIHSSTHTLKLDFTLKEETSCVSIPLHYHTVYCGRKNVSFSTFL